MKTSCFANYQGPGRISIARYAPRNTPAGFRIFSRLAPGSWFKTVTKSEYIERFDAMLAALDPQETWDTLHKLAGDAEPVLLCWEKPPFDEVKNWCHRRMVAEWFEAKLGVEVPELHVPKKGGGKKKAPPKKRGFVQESLNFGAG